jgi:putative transcriptional regulator
MKSQDFNDLLKSIDEARAIRAGKRKPSRVIAFNPVEVKAIRRRLHVSQVQFATLIGVSVSTLRNWEQGRTYPEGAARVLLKVAAHRPDAVLETLRSQEA